MTDTEAEARAAIAPLREGLREFDFQRLAKASSELVRSGVLEVQSRNRTFQDGGLPKMSSTDVEKREREHPSG